MSAHETTLSGSEPALFEHYQIRRDFHDGKWRWAIVDIIKALTGSANPRRYWSDLKRDIVDKEGFSELYAKIVRLKMRAADGKERETDAADMETVFRIIQSVPSPKAEPFKRWLAKVGSERVHEEADPGLAIERAISSYRRRGWTSDRIKARIDGILKRRELTDEWQKRGVKGAEYGILTNAMYRLTFNLDANGLRYVKGLRSKANPREYMSGVELALVNLGEAAAVEFSRDRDTQGFSECKSAAEDGAMIAGGARRQLETKLGRSVITVEGANDQLPMFAKKGR